MINDIVEKIGKSLNQEFGENYTIYSENMPQNFETPCFFIECIKYSRGKALSISNRFIVSVSLSITYFPDENNLNQNEQMWEVADRIFDSVEYIENYSGDNLKSEFSDDALVVTVDYVFQAVKKSDKNYMNNLKQKGAVKNGG